MLALNSAAPMLPAQYFYSVSHDCPRLSISFILTQNTSIGAVHNLEGVGLQIRSATHAPQGGQHQVSAGNAVLGWIAGGLVEVGGMM